MKKLAADFGVTALFGTIILVGSFTLLGIGVARDKVDFRELLSVLAAWVSGIVTGYIVVKARKP